MDIKKYKDDIKKLIEKGELLLSAAQRECHTKLFDEALKNVMGEKSEDYIKGLPSMTKEYQAWYSESLALIKFSIPDRADDFTGYYKKEKNRKSITAANYVVEDYLQGVQVAFAGDIKADKSCALPVLEQQVSILKAAERRFQSSLFDVRQVVQADLFDSELDSAKELNNKGFIRAAGAIAGVVLEKHLLEICKKHVVEVTRKDPSINDYNQALKDADVIDMKDWRFIQHLADIRNLCDHKKSADPKKEDVEDLINGVSKVSKTIY